ncbi:ribonucleoside-diphosphate reductase subunit beta [Parasponia andersonii]|uniref:Ribonucleoside-diphosphate reductase subunit beta n=1 Tax=Parasponia andersonii TaxID=3476 RepID=A0A2P5DVI3_PARAD|nr:ribonucleoside-diphosphate reductase subunit beta [Parasponia andersonii]
MSNPGEETLAEVEEEGGGGGGGEGEDVQRGSDNDDNGELSHEWETMARAWLCSFAGAKDVSMAEVEAWIDSNLDSIPQGIKSMPRPDLCQRLISIQNCIRPVIPNQEKEESQVDTPHARFQRTDQWRPVYSWLESLDKDEAVKSKDISDWLAENPQVMEQLCSRHSRYHLMHYIKKCHMKILRRRDRKKGFQQSEKFASLKVNKDVVMKQPVAPVLLPSMGNSPIDLPKDLPKDSEAYLAKRKEAFQKYEILVELEKLFSPSFKPQDLIK